MKSTIPTSSKLLNVGCGKVFETHWTNIDIAPSDSSIISLNAASHLPFANDTFSVVYNSAFIEHLATDEATRFVRECFRVMEPGGIIRIGTPDMEQLCRLYLDRLEKTSTNEAYAGEYDWMVIEIQDQCARDSSGGRMLEFMVDHPTPCTDFIRSRIGPEYDLIMSSVQRHPPDAKYVVHQASTMRRLLRSMKRTIASYLLGDDYMDALKIGRFRQSGEIHHWLYDRFSLARLLRQAGFQSPIPQTARTSGIADWAQYHLDITETDLVRKPDLFFMEATKPHQESGAQT